MMIRRICLRYFQPGSVMTRSQAGYANTLTHLTSSDDKNKLNDRSAVLSGNRTDAEIIEDSFNSFLKKLNEYTLNQSLLEVNPWRTPLYVPKNEYYDLIEASMNLRKFELLTGLLNKTHTYPVAAASIGIPYLWKLHQPFLNSSAFNPSVCDNGSDQSQVLSRLAEHFANWLRCMDQNSFHIQIDVLLASTLSFCNNDIELALRFYNYLASALHHELKTSLDAGDPMVSVPNSNPGIYTQSSFILYVYEHLHKTGYATEAKLFLHNILLQGYLTPESVEPVLYANLIIRSLTITNHAFSSSSGDTYAQLKGKRPERNFDRGNVILDGLFELHMGGSDSPNVLLREYFYKSLIQGGCPRTLLQYEERRREAGVALGVLSHNKVIEAHAAIKDIDGVFSHLKEWSLTGVDELPYNQSAQSKSTPDTDTYVSVISFLQTNPKLVTTAHLGQLMDSIENHRPELKDYIVLELFYIARRLKSPTLINRMLLWFCGEPTRSGENESASQQPAMSLNAINNTSVKYRISRDVLSEIYRVALETTSYGKNAVGMDCFRLMLDMKRRDMELTGDVVKMVMSAMKASKKYETVLEIFNCMSQFGVSRDVSHVSLAVHAYFRTDKVWKGIALIQKFQKAGQCLDRNVNIIGGLELLRMLVKSSTEPLIGRENKPVSTDYVIDQCVELFGDVMKDCEIYPSSVKVLGDIIRQLDTEIYNKFESRLDILVNRNSTDDSNDRGALKFLQMVQELRRKPLKSAALKWKKRSILIEKVQHRQGVA
eukprot:CAMPEP_0185028854 /NCGR_PEP_ID=MMETSP1103-20130426/14906_1 /TAXON_ID=36769 /ORGANISM="Paraphysomonas bandaiensis, Strain Caron Lab Isolate" /LENGTH=768 /DNA_ID=CAMNT_0027563417 /DNA_START=52 /DNA_END=2354 /DNA_ORIENTATION=-